MKIDDAEIPVEVIGEVCRKWKIRRLELFGSARTGRLRDDSDIDLLVEFEPEERWSLLDLARAEEEFSRLFGRRAELVDRRSLQRSMNWVRRDAILQSTEVIYGA